MAQYDGSIRINTKITTKEASAQLMTLENRIKKTADKVSALRSKMDSLKSAKIPTQEYSNLDKELGVITEQYDKLAERQYKFLSTGGKEGSSTYKRMEYDLDALDKKQDEIIAKMKALKASGKAFTLGGDTEEFTKLGQQLKYAEGDLSALTQKHDELTQKQKTSSSGYQKLGKTAKIVFSSVGNTVKKSAISSFKFLGKEIKKATSYMLGFGKSAKKSGGLLSTIGSRFKGLALSLLLFNQISKAFNSMIAGIKKGIGNLAQISSPVNSAVSSLVSSLAQLKNSLATAFAPILTKIAPILTSFINLLSKAATYVGMFIAALTGQKTFTKAVTIQEDYAASLGKTSSAAKDAAKAIKGYLSPLDEINKMESPDTSVDSGGGAGGAGINPTDMFETVPIENSISDMVQKIKDIIHKEDWEGLGSYIASGLNSGLQKIYDVINWDNVGPQITYFITAFTAAFNSLVNNFEWDTLGKTIGTGINTIVNTLNLLITGINWIGLGKSFATGIMGIVNEVNWTNLGNLIGSKFMIAWDTFYGFVTSLNFEEIGLALADAINGAIQKINLGMIVESLSTFVVGILNALSTAIENTDWSSVGQQIADALRAIDWMGIASGLFDVGLQLINGLLEAFGELPLPVQIAAAAIGGFLAALAITSAITTFIGAIQGVISVFGSLLASNPIGLIIAAIGALIAIIVLAITHWDDIKEAIQSFWDKCVEIFSGIGQWFAEKFEMIKNAVSSAWEFIKSLTSNIWNGIKNGISSVIEGIKNGISSALNAIKSIWDRVWTGLKNTVTNIFNGIWNFIKGIINGIIGGIEGMANGVIGGINFVIRALNKLHFDIPDWVPGLGGKGFGFNIPELSKVSIPRLATGTVVPPNREFMAVLGDNKREPEVVSPLSTMKQAVLEAIAEAGGMGEKEITIKIPVYISDKQVYESVVKYGKVRQMATGKNEFMLGTT